MIDLKPNGNIQEGPPPEEDADGLDLSLADVEDLSDGAEDVNIELSDGSVIVSLGGVRRENVATGSRSHDANLAEYMDDADLSFVASDVLDGIDADDESRSEWKDVRAQVLDLLGLEIKVPSGDVTNTSAPLEGMSTIKHPLLLEACIWFQSNSALELLPPGGPVKIDNEGDESLEADDDANALMRQFNHYLTKVAVEYYPDTERTLFMTGLGGCAFKKVYNCPIRNRPVSASVDAEYVIVSQGATDIQSAKRVTHESTMRPSIMRRMQLIGAYRDVDLMTPTADPSVVEEKKAAIEGVNATPSRTEDADYTVYECYCELDLPGFEHKERGKETGLPLPYKVVIERDSRQILEIRRNWREDDPMFMPRRPFVKYGYIPGIGFYDIGLGHILGNTTLAVTAAWREMLDAGMFACFPGFLFAEDRAIGKQKTNTFRVPPGSGVGIQTGGDAIGDVVSPLPYRAPGAEFQAFIEHIEDVGSRLGNTATTQAAADAPANQPVGTTMANIDQMTRTPSAVHMRIQRAQAEEFQMLVELFRENPEALWRGDKSPAKTWTHDLVVQALDNYTLVPVADPSTPSNAHRIMKSQAVGGMYMETPDLFDGAKVREYQLKTMGIANPAALLAAPAEPEQPPADPVAMAAVENDRQRNLLTAQTNLERIKLDRERLQFEQMKLMADMQQKEAERLSKERIAAEREETARLDIDAKMELAEDDRANAAMMPVVSSPSPVTNG